MLFIKVHDNVHSISSFGQRFFHVVVWMLLSTGIICNLVVVVWRHAQKRDQRLSPLSILIIMLAVSGLLCCVHLLLLESLVTEAHLGQFVYFGNKALRVLCALQAPFCLGFLVSQLSGQLSISLEITANL